MATATSAARRLARWPAVVQWTGSAHWANAADNSAPARTYDEVAATKTMRRTRQIATLCRLEGPQAAGMVGEGQIIVERAPASTGRVALVTEASHYRHFAGWRSDPFFFDRRGMLNNLWFTGEEWIKHPLGRVMIWQLAIGCLALRLETKRSSHGDRRHKIR